MKRTFDVELVKGGVILVTEYQTDLTEPTPPVVIAAGSPCGVAKELKTVFEAMKKSA